MGVTGMGRSGDRRRACGPGGSARFEALEARMVMSATAAESYLLELINRARLDPVAEGVRLGIDLEAGLTSSERARLGAGEVLGFDDDLLAAARAQAVFMAGEGSATTLGPTGQSPTNLAKARGYPGSAGAVAGGEAGGLDAAAIDALYEGWMADVASRKTVLGLFATFSDALHWEDFGAGLVVQDGTAWASGFFGFPGASARAKLVGVAFDDVDMDGFADLGEALDRVQVDVSPVDDPNRLSGSVLTGVGGAFAIALADGSYTVRFTNLATGLERVTGVVIAGSNVKVDVTAAEMVEEPTGNPLDGGRLEDGATPSLATGADVALVVGFLNRNGAGAVLRREGQVWRLEIAGVAAGAPALSGGLEAWYDGKDGLLYAAAPSTVGLILLRRDAAGVWSFRNLSEELSGPVVTSGVTAFVDGAGLRYVAGLTGDGELALYAQTGQSNQDASLVWAATNLSTEHLAVQGQVTPAFTGELISFVTPWNALNVAGLDVDGNVRAVWFAPGRPLWSAVNLSAQTGAARLTGGLTAWLTSWNALNIAGIDESGNLSAVWWVPGFDAWRRTNLTGAFDGPELQGGSVSSFVTSWGAMNVVGLDAAGRVRVYWWVPGFDAWQVSDLSAQSGSGAGVLVGGLRAGVSPTGEMSVVGARETGDVGRLWWRPGRSWAFEDVSGSVS